MGFLLKNCPLFVCPARIVGNLRSLAKSHWGRWQQCGGESLCCIKIRNFITLFYWSRKMHYFLKASVRYMQTTIKSRINSVSLHPKNTLRG